MLITIHGLMDLHPYIHAIASLIPIYFSSHVRFFKIPFSKTLFSKTLFWRVSKRTFADRKTRRILHMQKRTHPKYSDRLGPKHTF
jgi:hypothetical protein